MAQDKPPIYLDYNGTTPIDEEVCEAMTTMMRTDWGNPSSSHYYGVRAKRGLENARRQTATLIGAQPGEIIFMSNGTETINHALKGLAELGRAEGRTHFITQASEHVAVLEVCRALEKHGCTVTYLPVDADGLVSSEAVAASITPRTVCVSIMHSNNETGTLQPIEEIVKKVRQKATQQGKPIYVHCDTSQSLGKLKVDVASLDIDFLTVAGHKLYAPKGVGALYRRASVPDLPLFIHGAGQEGGRRASTENVVHIVGLGKACEIAHRDLETTRTHMLQMRDRLHSKLAEHLGERKQWMRCNGPPDARLPNTLSVSFYRVEANTLLSEISDDVAASAGAACHSDEVHMSHVLEAMGVAKDWAMGTCRFTVGKGTTIADVDTAARIIATAAARLMPALNGVPAATHDVTTNGKEIKLTHFTHGMGCACKLRPQMLERVLDQVRALAGPSPVDGNVLAGLGASNEDACVYKINDQVAIVSTLDFFTPIVDEPDLFGAVAAANAISDVYAMGARPIFALNIVGFPSGRLPDEVLVNILKGGQEKCAEAGIPILGGHTVEDVEPKYGLAVVGTVHPERIWRNNGLEDGDSLILTKPLGTGVLSTALKRGALGTAARHALIGALTQLNAKAAESVHAYGCKVHAATDVTGFGLLGHLREMLTPPTPNGADGPTPAKRPRGGEPMLSAHLRASVVPFLPEARELAVDDQCVPGGSINNLKSAEDTGGVKFAIDVPHELKILLADAQTSGGLLLAVPGADADGLLLKLRESGLNSSAVIGQVRAREVPVGPVISVDM